MTGGLEAIRRNGFRIAEIVISVILLGTLVGLVLAADELVASLVKITEGPAGCGIA